jgi:hypothetical protein
MIGYVCGPTTRWARRLTPLTQRVIPGAGVVDRVEIWVRFSLEGYNVDAAEFCKQASTKTRQLAVEMTAKFGLS